MVTYSGDIEDQDQSAMTTVSKRSRASLRTFTRQAASEFEAISFWGILLLIGGGMLVYSHLIPPGWLDSMVLADMLLQGWVGENQLMLEQFDILQAVEPGQLTFLSLAGISAALGSLVAPVVAAVLALVLITLALHALVNVNKPRRRTPSWPLSILALSLLSGLVLHHYPPGILFGLTFSLTSLAVWRHRFSKPDIAGTLLLTLALTLTLGMDFQIFAMTVLVLGILALGEGLLEIRRLGLRPALTTTAFRLLMLLIALIPAALMLTYFTRMHTPDWGAILLAFSLNQTPSFSFPRDVMTYARALSAFPQSEEPWLIIGLVGVCLVFLLMGLLFRPFRGRVEPADMLFVAGAVLVGLAVTSFRDSLMTTTGALTGAKLFWLGLILLITWSALSPMVKPLRTVLMAASVVITAGLTGNRVLTYENLSLRTMSVGNISGLAKKGSTVIGLDFDQSGNARQAASLMVLQQGALNLGIPALSDSPAARLLVLNPPLKSRPGRELDRMIGGEVNTNPAAVTLDNFDEISGRPVGSVFVSGSPPASQAGEQFSKYLKRTYEPVYRFTSGSLAGLTMYQPRSTPLNTIGDKTQ